ncbi:MAG: A/G-specific adenine glycosylase [Acidobacteria bacterium]|nr:A/G-specific adenine glycosylase [Acidobacteriota bacterium]
MQKRLSRRSEPLPDRPRGVREKPPAHPTARVEGSFASRLLSWWDVAGRKDLPWQRDPTPYRVWVSEIMLQQTRASTVAPYFERFVLRFPDVHALARAELDEVLHLWSGLGYYARARNLHRAAGIVAREHGGVVPGSAEAVEALPGVGRSTAAAVVAQGYGRRAAILDANVKRVLARRHRVAGPVSSSATLTELWRLAESHTPAERVADYTQAIMDLGATVCRRSRPRCGECPVRVGCAAFEAGEPERYPERAARRQRRLERRRFFVVVDPNGACLVEQRPPRGLWGGLWSPPERDAGQSVDGFLDQSGIAADLVDNVQAAGVFRHGFTHYDLDVEPVYVRLKARPAAVRERSGRWIDPHDHRLGLSKVAARLVGVTTLFDGPKPGR